MDEDEGQRSRKVEDLDRIVAFSDGVFAFAITLLVVQFTVPALSPNVANKELASKLLALQPHFISYVISFLVIGAFWRSHRITFKYILRSDDAFGFLNLLLLLTIAFQPFPTAVLGAYDNTQAAIIFYASTLSITGLLMFFMWFYATSGYRLVSRHIDPRVVRLHTLQTLSPAVIFLLSILISFFSINMALYSWILIYVVSKLLNRIY